jgi:hypothetical protein
MRCLTLSVCRAGADNTVQVTNMTTRQSLATPSLLSTHTAPVRCVVPASGAMLSGGLDSVLCVWDEAAARAVQRIALPERCYALAARSHWVVAACAERQLAVYDMRVCVPCRVTCDYACVDTAHACSLDRPYRISLSPLKFMSRAVDIAPNCQWFGVTSIEGENACQRACQRDT